MTQIGPVHRMLFFICGLSLMPSVVQSDETGDCQTNAWTKPVNGYWQQQSFWSCGHLPSRNQAVVVTNAGFKTLVIDRRTTASYSNSLAVKSLLINAPPRSANVLLLRGAGTNVPLSAESVLIGRKGSLISHRSALDTRDLRIDSSALFAGRSQLLADKVQIDGKLSLHNCLASLGLLVVGRDGTLIQRGGSADAYGTLMDAGSTFVLRGGTFRAGGLFLQSHANFPYSRTLTNGVATFRQEGGDTTVNMIRLGVAPWIAARGEFVMSGGSLNCGQIDFLNGRFVQSGGTNYAGPLRLPAPALHSPAPPLQSAVSYGLSGGSLISGTIALGYPRWPDPPIPGSFGQSGGFHYNEAMVLNGQDQIVRHYGVVGHIHLGFYGQSGGVLVSESVQIRGGGFGQSGGTNFTTALTVAESGAFSLSGGELITSNTVVNSGKCHWNRSYEVLCFPSVFSQEGGTHIVNDTLRLGGKASYKLQSGTLIAFNISVGGDSELDCADGTIINSGLCIIGGGFFRAGSQSHHLGQLQAVGYTATLDVSGPPGTELHFRDSRDVAWTTPGLRLIGWDPASRQLFVGSSSDALTAEQLNLVMFVNPTGLPVGEYAAQLLPTGELVPR